MTKKRGKEAARIYVMRSDQGWIKVGRSIEPKSRKIALGYQKGYGTLTVEYMSDFYTTPNAVEKAAHKLLRQAGKHIGHHHNSEKFSATVAEAVQAIGQAVLSCKASRAESPPPRIATTTARTYRLTKPLLEAIERVRMNMLIPPSETTLVEVALWDFVRREEGEHKREARR